MYPIHPDDLIRLHIADLTRQHQAQRLLHQRTRCYAPDRRLSQPAHARPFQPVSRMVGAALIRFMMVSGKGSR